MVTFDKTYAPDTIAAKDIGRYAFNGVHVDPAKGRMVATNGMALVSVPCEAEGDAEKAHAPVIAPVGIIKAARTAKGYWPASVSLNGQCSTLAKDGSRMSADVVEGEFPDVEPIIRDAVKVNASGSIVLGINAEYLAKLARALGDAEGKVYIEIPAADEKGRHSRCMIVTRHARKAGSALPEAFGLLMPVTAGSCR